MCVIKIEVCMYARTGMHSSHDQERGPSVSAHRAAHWQMLKCNASRWLQCCISGLFLYFLVKMWVAKAFDELFSSFFCVEFLHFCTFMSEERCVCVWVCHKSHISYCGEFLYYYTQRPLVHLHVLFLLILLDLSHRVLVWGLETSNIQFLSLKVTYMCQVRHSAW